MFSSAYFIIPTVICAGLAVGCIVLLRLYLQYRGHAEDMHAKAKKAEQHLEKARNEAREIANTNIRNQNIIAAIMNDNYNYLVKVDLETGKYWQITVKDGQYSEHVGDDTWENTVGDLLKHLHPHDVEIVREYCLKTIYRLKEGEVASIAYKTRLHVATWSVSGDYEWDSSNTHIAKEGDHLVAYILNRNETEIVENELRSRKLSQENQLLTLFNKGMPGGYHRCTNEEGYPFAYMDDMFLSIVGYSRLDIKLLFEDKFMNMVHPEDRNLIVDHSNLCIDTPGTSQSVEFRMKTKKGYIWVVDSTKITEFDGRKYYQSIIVDVTDQHELRDSLTEKNRELGTILNAMPGGFALMGCDDRFLYYSVREELPRLLGYTVEEFMEMTMGSALGAIYEEDRTDIARLMRDAVSKGETDFIMKHRMVCKNGMLKMMNMNARVIRGEDGEQRIYAFYIDVTKEQETTDLIALQQKIVEEERANKVLLEEVLHKERNYKQSLQAALSTAEKANEAKSLFLNSMSHDIRTPMNAILGFAGLARKHIHEEDRVEDALQKIELSGNHLLSLINDVLDMSKIESGAVKLETEPYSMRKLLEELDIMFRQEAEKKNLTLLLDANIRNDSVLVDVLRMNQILLNIVSNGVKYTPAGGKVSVRVDQKESSAVEGAASFVITCEDNGIGMDKHFVGHVFEAFAREQTSTISGIQGTGLGMAITKQLVEMMGGSIEVESEKDVGTTFRIFLDLPIVQEGPAAEEEKQENFNFFGVKVLLVEDNELNREIAEELLKDAGFIVDTAEDGLYAVEKMQEAKADTYDLILMDIQMPNLDGYGASTAIRQMEDEKKASIPIIAMTANAFSEDRQKALDCGMNGHVPKPIDIEVLYSTIHNVLQNKQQQLF